MTTEYDKGKYSKRKINRLITRQGFIPIASPEEFSSMSVRGTSIMGVGTIWEGTYTRGDGSKYVQVRNLDFIGATLWRTPYKMLLDAAYLGNELLISNVTDATVGMFSGVGVVKDVIIKSYSSAALGQAQNVLGTFLGGTVRNVDIDAEITNLGTHKHAFVGTHPYEKETEAPLKFSNITMRGYIGGNAGVNTYCAAPFGYLKGTVDNPVIVEECETDVTVDCVGGRDWIAGFAGEASNCIIERCCSFGDVSGGRVGQSAFLGYASGNAHIKDCYAWGDVHGNKECGGLVGRARYGGNSIVNSYYQGEVTATDEQSLGGLVARLVEEGDLVAKSSYWDMTVGPATSAAGIGKTTNDLQDPTTPTGIYNGWEKKYWDFGTSDEYPTLK